MATRLYDRLILTSGQTYTQVAGDTIKVLAYVTGDWDGAIITSTGTWYLQMPAGGVAITDLNITNCDASGGGDIDATDGGVDGGGNSENIDFGGATPVAAKGGSGTCVCVGIGL